nr:hypothetical protein [Faecalibaculum rodentium]
MLYIFCQSLTAVPLSHILCISGIRIDRWQSLITGWNFNHGFVDHDCDRIQVIGMGFQPQTFAFQRNGTATREGIQQFRDVISHALFDFCLGFFQDLFVVGVFPDNELFQDSEEPFSFLSLLDFCGEQLGMGAGIIHQTRPDDGPGRSQRSSGPPQM